MVNLITDRTQDHVILRNRLARKGWANMTASEREIWLSGDAIKGAYNFTDLNRVESAVAEISDYFGLGLTTKTDWNNWDYLTEKEMNRYLNNVKAIVNAFPDLVGFPELPYNMHYLTYESANNIEIALLVVHRYLASVRCGEIYCGEV